MTDGAPSQRIYPTPGRSLLLLLGAAALTTLGVLFIRFDTAIATELNLAPRLISGLGWACAVMFGGSGLYVLVRVLRPAPLIIIDEQGITDRASMVAAGLIPWEAIAAVRIDAMTVPGGSQQHFVGIELRDPDAFLVSLPVWKQWSLRSNRRMGMPPVLIPTTMMEPGVVELCCRIRDDYHRHCEAAEGVPTVTFDCS